LRGIRVEQATNPGGEEKTHATEVAAACEVVEVASPSVFAFCSLAAAACTYRRKVV
jgi:hypothetical protein